jgi:hypothetical protein
MEHDDDKPEESQPAPPAPENETPEQEEALRRAAYWALLFG